MSTVLAFTRDELTVIMSATPIPAVALVMLEELVILLEFSVLVLVVAAVVVIATTSVDATRIAPISVAFKSYVVMVDALLILLEFMVDALRTDRFNGSLVCAVLPIVVMPPTVEREIPVPAAKLLLMSPVRVLQLMV